MHGCSTILQGCLFVTAIWVIAPRYVQAQDFTLFEYELLTISEIQNPETPAQDSLEVITSRLHFFGAFPLIQSERFKLLNGVAYDLWLFDFDQYQLATRRIDNLHYLRYQLGFIHDLGSDWGLTAVVAPGLASDFRNGINSEDWRFQALALARKRVHDDFSYGVGGAFTTDFGTPVVVPVINLSWETDTNIKIAGLLPRTLGVWIVPNEDNEIGLRAAVSGSKFHLREASANRESDIDVKYSVLSIGPEVKQRLAGPIFLKLEGGYTLFRTFRFEGPEGEGDLELENNIYFRGGLVFRPDFID